MLNFAPPQQQAMAKGGLAEKAKEVRDAGRGGDTMLVHVNPIEFKWLKEHFGPGGTNPHTGMPEFSFLDWLMPVISNVVAPGLGDAVGGALGGVLGITSPTLTSAIGGAAIGGGLNALLGGNIGTGALAGGLAPSVLGGLGLTGTNGALAGLNMFPSAASAASSATGYDPTSIGNGMGGINNVSNAASGGSSITSSLLKAAPLLLTVAALGKKQPENPPQYTSGWAPDNTNSQHLSNVKFNRVATNPTVTPYYGINGGETSFFANNALPAAEGRYVKGGGTGTSDDIPAKLSDGEYVIDAQTVSMLGDGSSDAGAQKLDAMRESIRKQKGSALSKGKFAPDAKNPLAYMKGA